MPLVAAHRHPINLADFHHHLGIHRSGAQEIQPRQGGHGDYTSTNPAVSLNDGLGLPFPLLSKQLLGGLRQTAALQKNVVGQQFFPLLPQHGRQPLQ